MQLDAFLLLFLVGKVNCAMYFFWPFIHQQTEDNNVQARQWLLSAHQLHVQEFIICTVQMLRMLDMHCPNYEQNDSLHLKGSERRFCTQCVKHTYETLSKCFISLHTAKPSLGRAQYSFLKCGSCRNGCLAVTAWLN